MKPTKVDARVKNKEYGFKRLKQALKHVVTCVDDSGKLYSIPLDQYKKDSNENNASPHKHVNMNKVAVFDTINGESKSIPIDEYYKNSNQYLTSTKGKVLAKNKQGENLLITAEEFLSGNYVGQTSGLRLVKDVEINQYVQITEDEFIKNRHKYQGPNKGKINAINKQTGIRCQIPKSDFNKEIYSGLGNRAMLFPCRNKLTGKEKNVNIYEWDNVKDNYDILDINKFNKATKLKQTVG